MVSHDPRSWNLGRTGALLVALMISVTARLYRISSQPSPEDRPVRRRAPSATFWSSDVSWEAFSVSVRTPPSALSLGLVVDRAHKGRERPWWLQRG